MAKITVERQKYYANQVKQLYKPKPSLNKQMELQSLISKEEAYNKPVVQKPEKVRDYLLERAWRR